MGDCGCSQPFYLSCLQTSRTQCSWTLLIIIGLTSRRSQPPLALAVPLSRFTSRVGGGSAFYVRPRPNITKAYWADWESRRIHHDPILKPRVIYWFVELSTKPPTALGFLRSDVGGSIVIGGVTGSHLSGHSEGWWEHFCRVVASPGCIPIEEAVRCRAVPPDWSPPPFSDEDTDRVRRIQKNGRLY